MRSHAHYTATAALLLLTLTGCASTPTGTAGETTAPGASTPSPTATVAPLTVAPAPPPSDVEATFLFELRKRTDMQVVVDASDEQLLAAGHAACDALAVTPDIDALRLVEGEVPRDNGRYFTSVVIGTHAQTFMCPETKQ
ncbi:hypothetical protein J2Y69_002142 [Microbacterium resistens]|uniref:DUF732 domain-containing protein n=1 Tax=Microbacterium resistens TaxID=156977 RepID=A0ABU1SD46_9MICO|nr:hypothetical protein [Microbacterium resistens]MDR6867538.1 hypothetical protein [Microbacterium resistens]